MKIAGFPLPALVGLDALKLALQLAAIDLRLSVLIQGEKGAGKSTAARGLAQLMHESAPFINVPIGSTEDRLLGGLDIERALNGEPVLKHGMLAQANAGVLYVDEINLLPDHLADSLLDAVASGVHTVEREGFSVTQDANFVMIGSMNPEEGALRPQLLDRFALAVDVDAPRDARVRADVLERRLAYDADPESFRLSWESERAVMACALVGARARLPAVTMSRDTLEYVAECVASRGVASLRADLAVVRAARALAALDSSMSATTVHVDVVLPLALAHRSKGSKRHSREPQPSHAAPQTSPSDQLENATADQVDARERVFAPVDVRTPRIVVGHDAAHDAAHDAVHGGASARRTSAANGPMLRARRTPEPSELDLRSTLLHAAVHGRDAQIRREDLHEKVREPRGGTRYIVVIDSSGSHAVQERMGLVKGAVSGLLAESHGRHDEVVAIGCRGASAQVLMEPTKSREDAERSLEYLATGGRTPLAHALELAAGYVNAHAVVVVLTDGHANVPHRGTDAWTDALTAARALNCPALVIDTEDERRATGRPKALAEAMHATYLRLSELDRSSVVRLIRGVA